MASLASFSSNSSDAPPPFLRLPLIISESLRTAISSDGSSTQGIVSILLSRADLAKLDLSNLQLFSVDGLAMEPAAAMASSEVASPQAEVKISPQEDFSFQTSLILSPVADLPAGAIAFPILKSKGVVEAEKATAEHNLLKLGAVSPSLRARKKAVSMDEISLNEQLSSCDVAAESNLRADIAGAKVRARRQLPALELAALPLPGLEQRAESLKKKHFERVLSRTLSEVRSEEAKIDLKASPAAKFLLQVMPWELTPSVTPVSTPAAIPFIWEDVPGRPKPRAFPSPCPSLPLPPRLLLAPPPSSSSAAAAGGALAGPLSDSTESPSLPANTKPPSPPVKSNPCHGRTHRKNMHSWHVLHNLFSGGHQQCPSHAVDASLEANKGSDNAPACEPNFSVAEGETSQDAVSSMTTSINSNSTSSDLSPSTASVSEDALGPCEPSLSAPYELPPLYVAPVVPLTPPHRDLGPLDDECLKQTSRLSYLANLFRQEKGKRKDASRTGSFFNRFNKHGNVNSESSSYLLDDAKGCQIASRIFHGVLADDHRRSPLRISAQLSPLASSLYRSPKPAKPRIHISSRSTKVFLKLRRRGTRVIVASYRAIKRAFFVSRRAGHSKLFDHTQLPYHMLHR